MTSTKLYKIKFLAVILNLVVPLYGIFEPSKGNWNASRRAITGLHWWYRLFHLNRYTFPYLDNNKYKMKESKVSVRKNYWPKHIQNRNLYYHKEKECKILNIRTKVMFFFQRIIVRILDKLLYLKKIETIKYIKYKKQII